MTREEAKPKQLKPEEHLPVKLSTESYEAAIERFTQEFLDNHLGDGLPPWLNLHPECWGKCRVKADPYRHAPSSNGMPAYVRWIIRGVIINMPVLGALNG